MPPLLLIKLDFEWNYIFCCAGMTKAMEYNIYFAMSVRKTQILGLVIWGNVQLANDLADISVVNLLFAVKDRSRFLISTAHRVVKHGKTAATFLRNDDVMKRAPPGSAEIGENRSEPDKRRNMYCKPGDHQSFAFSLGMMGNSEIACTVKQGCECRALCGNQGSTGSSHTCT